MRVLVTCQISLEMTLNPFDFVNAINMSKKDLIRTSDVPALAEKDYVPFIINKQMSYFIDTVFYANELNQHHNIANIMQNDYYLNSIRKGKRFAKWHKKDKTSDIEAVRTYYNVSYPKAQQMVRLLTAEQIHQIRTKIAGG